MFKKIISLFTAAVMLLAASGISAAVYAVGEAIELTDSNGITYTLTENADSETYTMTVSGSGDMQNYDYYTQNDRPYISYKDKITKVVIEQGITSIGEYAFCDCSAITSAEIPNTAAVIGTYAFERCTSLASIAIPEGVTAIGSYAFQRCSSLSSVTLPTTLSTVSYSAFDRCTSLTSVTIPGGVETINGLAFYGCSSLASVTISEGVKTINPSVFQLCDNLTSVTLPSTLTFIGSDAFAMCGSLTEIIIPENVTSICEDSFRHCDSLERIIYPANAVWDLFMELEPAIPETATQIKYEVIGGEVIITDIIIGTGKDTAEVPDTVRGYPVAEVNESVRDKVSESGHVHINESEATCAAKAVCKICGEYGEMLPHTGGTATCIQKAVCDVCKTEYGDLAEHTEDSGEITIQPTETTAGEMTYRCTVCGVVIRTASIDTLEHTHVYGTEWNYDTSEHWHECACGDKADEASHTPDTGTVTKQPTPSETGIRTYCCTVCGAFIFSETIPAAGTSDAPYIPYIPWGSTVLPVMSAPKEPFISNSSNLRGWDTIASEIAAASDGSTVTIDMNSTTELPKDIVSAISGRDIDLVLDMSGYSWTVNGMSVTKVKTVDMSVRKVSKIPEAAVLEIFGDIKTVQFDLQHNGDFGFTAELTVYLGKRYSGMYANSYCYRSRQFEFGDSSEIVDGRASLRFDHASSWLITIENSPAFEDVSSAAAAYSSDTPIDMSDPAPANVKSLPDFIDEKKYGFSSRKRRYRILRKRRLDDLVFVF